jgi:hypothetical protein
MGQHLYPCQCCGAQGVANYVLRPVPDSGPPTQYENVRVCTGCRKAKCISPPYSGQCRKTPAPQLQQTA